MHVARSKADPRPLPSSTTSLAVTVPDRTHGDGGCRSDMVTSLKAVSTPISGARCPRCTQAPHYRPSSTQTLGWPVIIAALDTVANVPYSALPDRPPPARDAPVSLRCDMRRGGLAYTLTLTSVACWISFGLGLRRFQQRTGSPIVRRSRARDKMFTNPRDMLRVDPTAGEARLKARTTCPTTPPPRRTGPPWRPHSSRSPVR